MKHFLIRRILGRLDGLCVHGTLLPPTRPLLLLFALWMGHLGPVCAYGQTTSPPDKQKEVEATLKKAIDKGDLAQVNQYLASIPDVNTFPLDEGSILGYAIAHRQLAIVKSVVAKGANVNQGSPEHTYLMEAAFADEDNSAIINFLVSKGADIKVRDSSGLSALIYAIRSENLQNVKAVLRHGADTHIVTKYDGGVLNEAVVLRKENAEMVRLLLQYGAPVNTRDSQGHTPLLDAVRQGRFESMKLLLSRGADVLLADSKDHYTPLHAAASHDLSFVQPLIRAGAKVDPKDESGRTPLMNAALWGRIEVMRLLLAKGAEAKSADNYGRTILMEAAQADEPEKLALLLKHGADLYAADREGTTALHYAAQAAAAQSVRFLLKQGAADRNKTAELNNALFAALDIYILERTVIKTHRWGIGDTVRVLLDAGADVRVKNAGGQTPLRYNCDKIA